MTNTELIRQEIQRCCEEINSIAGDHYNEYQCGQMHTYGSLRAFIDKLPKETLQGREYTIPEGMLAVIENGKVIIREKVSEEERMWDKILNHFDWSFKGPYLTHEECDEIKAFLVKQKEQNAIPSRKIILGIWELGNLWEENPEERNGLTKLQYIQKYWFEKCDYIEEQKLVEAIEGSEDKRIRKFFAELATDACGGPGQEYYEELGLNYEKVISWLEKRKEQKPVEQIEDDEEKSIGTTLIDALKGNALLEWELKRAGVDAKKLIAYLEQKPTEWSEDIIRKAIKEVGLTQHQIDWLKSLSPQSHWKPSEEQMKALEAAFRKDGNDEYRRTINSLYTDLQKLL